MPWGKQVNERRPPAVSPILADFVPGLFFPEHSGSSAATVLSVLLSLSFSCSVSLCQLLPETSPMFLVRILLFVFALPAKVCLVLLFKKEIGKTIYRSPRAFHSNLIVESHHGIKFASCTLPRNKVFQPTFIQGEFWMGEIWSYLLFKIIFLV